MTAPDKDLRYHDRDLSWLAFNYRVLQEAADVSVPLFERLRFLAIFSSNLDEFFRVRVALARSLASLPKHKTKKRDIEPRELLRRIHRIVKKQQDNFGDIYRSEVLPELNAAGIYIPTERQITRAQRRFVRRYFREKVQKLLQPVIIDEKTDPPFLKNKALYLTVQLIEKDQDRGAFRRTRRSNWAILEIPSEELGRFVQIPASRRGHAVMFLDDIIRDSLPLIFPRHEPLATYSIKLTRDAEMYLDDETSGDLVARIRAGIKKRHVGVPARFLYDMDMPEGFLAFLRHSFELSREDLVPGGRYHNFNDFFAFPTFGRSELEYPRQEVLAVRELEKASGMFEAIAAKDRLLHFPYQSFGYVTRFLQEAAADPDVEQMFITLYRVASSSEIVQALIRAAASGKQVIAFVEVKARFDEELNIYWAEEMQKAGVEVLYSMPELKVHAKVAWVTRRENGKLREYAYIGTGNFNEKTARVYTDFGLLTAAPAIVTEVGRVFEGLRDQNMADKTFKHLLVAQAGMRREFNALIDAEIAAAEAGEPARIFAKMNSLEDRKMIKRLYRASVAGVEVRLIIRGICCLVPGLRGKSENIRITSIVGRYLEHPRVFVFHAGGREKMYIASADWMSRNLDSRVEVAVPLHDPDVRSLMRDLMSLHEEDNVKARIIDQRLANRYVAVRGNALRDAQSDTLEYLRRFA